MHANVTVFLVCIWQLQYSFTYFKSAINTCGTVLCLHHCTHAQHIYIVQQRQALSRFPCPRSAWAATGGPMVFHGARTSTGAACGVRYALNCGLEGPGKKISIVVGQPDKTGWRRIGLDGLQNRAIFLLGFFWCEFHSCLEFWLYSCFARRSLYVDWDPRL